MFKIFGDVLLSFKIKGKKGRVVECVVSLWVGKIEVQDAELVSFPSFLSVSFSVDILRRKR